MKLPLNFTLQPRLFALIALGFVMATIVGTLTHEAAHYFAAKYYGFKPVLHYDSVSYGSTEPYIVREFDSIYSANKHKIESKESSPEKEAFLKYRATVGEEINRQYFKITIAGPLQTILTGIFGLVMLWLRRFRIKSRGHLIFWEWILVFLSFFWSRQLANCLLVIIYYATGGNTSGGDEGDIAYYLGISHWIIDISGAVLATVAILWIIFKILPFRQRFTFIAGGIAGSITGWIVWMETFGPAILP